mmetsp:Transcript_7059/g.9810  ORF Transcript_7059/g.9810 Transcript_7059/m.9810 type:complete len:127 (-) Transcript_7059:297-677(-)
MQGRRIPNTQCIFQFFKFLSEFFQRLLFPQSLGLSLTTLEQDECNLSFNSLTFFNLELESLNLFIDAWNLLFNFPNSSFSLSSSFFNVFINFLKISSFDRRRSARDCGPAGRAQTKIARARIHHRK